MEGEGAARDLGSNAVLLRPREATFPFLSIGAAFAAAVFLRDLAIPGHHTFPIRVLYGNVQTTSQRVAFAAGAALLPGRGSQLG